MNADERQIEQEAIAIDLRMGAIVEEALVHANSTQICPASCFSQGGLFSQLPSTVRLMVKLNFNVNLGATPLYPKWSPRMGSMEWGGDANAVVMR